MQYFSLHSSRNRRVLGKKPQVNLWLTAEDVDIDDSRLIPFAQCIEVDPTPIIPSLILWDKANLTDFIDITYEGNVANIIVSESFKNLLDQYLDDRFQVFPTSLQHRGNSFNYWLIHAAQSNNEYIDLRKSKVSLVNLASFDRGTELAINNWLDFEREQALAKSKEGWWAVLIQSVAIASNVSDAIFVITNVDGGMSFIVSEVLKRVIEESTVTGLDFKPIAQDLIEWLGQHPSRKKSNK